VIGCELGYEQRLGLPLRAWEEIVSAFPSARFVDASELLWRLRVVKSPAEVDCLRKACQATSKAFEVCYSQAGEGWTEEQVA
ncbi:MAG TPA: hypothetical protein DCL63_02465, partial [Firmicutes bacterium]|nr:hypothetical protein [Bacillota bacterium]